MDGVDVSSPVAVLGAIALAAVAALIWLLKKRNGNGNGHAEKDKTRDQLLQILAYIEEHRTDMPVNWREFVDQRIEHKRRSDAMQFGILAQLLRRGHVDEAAGLLEMLERESKVQR